MGLSPDLVCPPNAAHDTYAGCPAINKALICRDVRAKSMFQAGNTTSSHRLITAAQPKPETPSARADIYRFMAKSAHIALFNRFDAAKCP